MTTPIKTLADTYPYQYVIVIHSDGTQEKGYVTEITETGLNFRVLIGDTTKGVLFSTKTGIQYGKSKDPQAMRMIPDQSTYAKELYDDNLSEIRKKMYLDAVEEVRKEREGVKQEDTFSEEDYEGLEEGKTDVVVLKFKFYTQQDNEKIFVHSEVGNLANTIKMAHNGRVLSASLNEHDSAGLYDVQELMNNGVNVYCDLEHVNTKNVGLDKWNKIESISLDIEKLEILIRKLGNSQKESHDEMVSNLIDINMASIRELRGEISGLVCKWRTEGVR